MSKVTKLDTPEEARFKNDYATYAKNTGMSANPDDVEHYYDYRGAWKSGVDLTKVKPEDHLSSQFKLEGHPRTYVDPKTGKGSKQQVEGYKKTYKKGGVVRGHGSETKGKTKGRFI